MHALVDDDAATAPQSSGEAAKPTSQNQANSQELSISPLRICLLGYRSHPYSGGQGIYLKYLSAKLYIIELIKLFFKKTVPDINHFI